MQHIKCEICHKVSLSHEVYGEGILSPSVRKLVMQQDPNWKEDSLICSSCLEKFRLSVIEGILTREKGELDALNEQVLESIREHQMITANLNDSYEDNLTFGQRLSDKMASFGGSWAFIIVFAAVIIVWITYNQITPGRIFDPYPFILLNLILSCLAAVQAPIIMMSQNRQESKDRMRSENDYLVNIKAELEIRQLHMKMDRLLQHQWQRLLELQELQIEIMNENLRHSKRTPSGGSSDKQ